MEVDLIALPLFSSILARSERDQMGSGGEVRPLSIRPAQKVSQPKRAHKGKREWGCPFVSRLGAQISLIWVQTRRGELFLSPRGRGGQEKRTGVGRGKQFIVGIAVARRGSGRGFCPSAVSIKRKRAKSISSRPCAF